VSVSPDGSLLNAERGITLDRHQYVIDPEIKGLLPAHSQEEASFLRANMALSKHCDDLVLLHIEDEDKNVLGDGHHREAVAADLGIEYNTRLVEVPDRPSALAWVIRNQLGRRNLTDERRSYYRGKEYLHERKTVGRPADGKLSHCETISAGATAKVIAERNGVSPATIHRDADFATACDKLPDDVKEKILNGTLKTSRKKVAEQAGTLCERCTRLGQETPKDGCAKCQLARRDAKKAATKKRQEKKREAKAQASDTVDAYGTAIPKGLLPAWNDPWIGETLEMLGVSLDKMLTYRPTTGLNKRAKHYPFYDAKDFEAGFGFATNYLQQLIEHLKEFRPVAVCPVCNGKKCGHCRQSGLVPRHAYDRITEKARARAKATAG
jgi:hypothetical protein